MRPARVLPVLLAALAAGPASAAPPPPSRPLSGWDGGTLGAGTAAGYAGLGWPGVEAGVRFGVADALDLGFDGSWLYPRGWLEGDVVARYLVWGRDRIAFSGIARAGIFRNTGKNGLNAGNREDTGLVLGLGLGAGYQFAEELLTVAVETPLALGLDDGTENLPLLLSAGLDHPLEGAGRPASIGFGFVAGPWGVGDGGASYFHLGFVVRATHGL